MDKRSDDIKRNIPSEEGTRNDPNIRDDSVVRPGVSTISSSDYDDENERTIKTASDSFRTENWGTDADAGFDDIVDDDDND
jgi:Tol biopolymer transport system component